jgi:hypothetical protein
MNESEIRKNLRSENLSILGQSLTFVNERLVLERSRSEKAEKRATVLLAVSGILSGFIVHFAKLIDLPNSNNTFLLSIFYIGAIFFVLKAGLYAIRALWALKGNELSPHLSFDIQELSEIDAIREETIWKIWEYYQLLPVGNERLYWTNKSQRNTIGAIVAFTFTGVLWFIQKTTEFYTPVILCFFIAFIMAIIVIFLDIFSEKHGNLWHLH